MDNQPPAEGRVLEPAEYYRLSQDLDRVRAILAQVRETILQQAGETEIDVLEQCIETHEYDDALGLLAVAEGLRDEDSLSPEVWQLIGRHTCMAKLQHITYILRLIPARGLQLRRRLEHLIADRAKRLAYATSTGDKATFAGSKVLLLAPLTFFAFWSVASIYTYCGCASVVFELSFRYLSASRQGTRIARTASSHKATHSRSARLARCINVVDCSHEPKRVLRPFPASVATG